MQHPDEGTIHAWLDGALTAEQAADVESHAAQCRKCSAAIAEARGFVAASSRILLALDDVPGGVIPTAVPKPRAWYARNELRAAAAVLLVTGGSLMIATGGQESSPRIGDNASLSMDTAASKTASTTLPEVQPIAAAPAQGIRKLESDAADVDGSGTRGGSADAVIAGQSAAKISRGNVSVRPSNEADFSGKGIAERGAARSDSASDRRFGSNQLQLNAVVVTGAAEANAIVIDAPLRIVRADTLAGVRTTVYEVSKGVEVTLIETTVMAFRQKSSLQGIATGATMNAPSAPVVPPSAARSVANTDEIKSITWTDSITGHNYTLSGALSREQLEALKIRIVEQRQHGFPFSRE